MEVTQPNGPLVNVEVDVFRKHVILMHNEYCFIFSLSITSQHWTIGMQDTYSVVASYFFR